MRLRFPLSDPAAYVDRVPHAAFAASRRLAPVAWVDEVPLWRHDGVIGKSVAGSGYWAVLRHGAVAAVSRQPEVFSSAARGAFLADPASREDLERTRQLLINMDAPQHTRVRRFLAAALTPQTVQQLQDSIRRHASSLAAEALRAGQFDAVRDLTAELPLLVLSDLLGMPHQDRRLMFAWSNNLVGFDDPEYGGGNIARYRGTFIEAFDYARSLAAARRVRPGQDLVSLLVECEIDGSRLTDAEFCHLWILLVVAGNESTRHFLSGALQALAEWPAERDRLVAEPLLIPTAVEELLRWVSPIMQFRRTAVRDLEMGGCRVREGDKVVLYYVSANRDEEIFNHPDTLDLSRAPNPHLAFGIGPHFCAGARLARAEAAILLDVLRPHLHTFEVVGPIVRLRSNFMNGIKSMPAEFTR